MLKPQQPALSFLLLTLILIQFPLPASAMLKTEALITLPQGGTQTTGAIRGQVYDADTKLPIAGAIVIARNQDTGLERATVTNAEGVYFVDLLPPGLYTVTGQREGYESDPNAIAIDFQVRVQKTNIIVPPPIALRRAGAAPRVATTPTSPQKPAEEQLVNTSNATRSENFDIRQLTTLPLPGIRTFESLAFLAPGVAPPPQPIGSNIGLGIGAGIGTAGQFSVNGQRARSNNFTIDGSDNNDEDAGVRRQGFASLVPQSIESTQEFQIFTHLWDARLGRNLGSQVNAVSRSGANRIHGTFYDFFNHSSLNARNFFDYTSDNAPPFYPLMAKLPPGVAINGSNQIPVVIRDFDNNFRVKSITPVVQPNPSEGKDLYQRNQGGVAIGIPISKKYFGPLGSDNPTKTFFFGSLERQSIEARQETHFSVPAVAERGFLGTGATGFCLINGSLRSSVNCSGRFFFPTAIGGDSALSLFPFPNNPTGPYGENTFTQVLPANAKGTIFSLKVDHNFILFGPQVTHTLTGRYNFTNDQRQLPSVGGAIFSGLEPHVGTQNLSLSLNSQLSARVANQLRGSYGRTRLRFNAVRDPFLSPSRLVPNDALNGPFLLNARRLINDSLFSNSAFYDHLPSSFGSDTESGLGPIGQLVVTPFSPVGPDVYLFPQRRTNNTYQIADTLAVFRGNHTFKFGDDLRRAQLNSLLNRNFRPQLVFGGVPDLSGAQSFKIRGTGFIQNLSQFGPTPGFISGADLTSIGLPSGSFQALVLPGAGMADTTIGLRSWQYNFFFNDNWRVRRGLTLDYGLRYEYNTVPREVNNRIEKTFRLDGLPAPDQGLTLIQLTTPPGPFFPSSVVFAFDARQLTAALNSSTGPLAALKNFLGGRQTIYDPDRNNFGPHLGFAWDPFAGSTTQTGKTSVRGGFGIYYDVALGSVVSQSRNVFPNFVPANLDINSFFLGNFILPTPDGGSIVINPYFVQLLLLGSNQPIQPGFLTARNTLNMIGVPPGAVQPLLGLLLNQAGVQDLVRKVSLPPSGSGLAFTLPDRKLRSPYALHFNLQVERELFKTYLVDIAYAGTRGVKLTRFRTPNGGLNTSPIIGLDQSSGFLFASALPPLSLENNRPDIGRLNPGLGAYSVFDSSASSSYHSLQASLTKRFSGNYQITAAYTYSHAIDDVSDVFDLAGAFALPQDDRDLKAERGNANFDLRHRFALSTVSNLPFLDRFNNASGAARVLLGGWQLASISTFQTGQPFTVNTSFDVNLDGNLTDRLNTTNGLIVTDNRQRRLIPTVPLTSLLPQVVNANGQVVLKNGAVGRNTFRASGIVNTDLTLIKNFRVKEGQNIVLRVEAFNVFNRTHFGIPVRILEAPSFGSAVNTVLPARQVQFALKYVF